MVIKVNGVRQPENIREVSASGTDILGFDFMKDSPRYVQSELSHAGIIPDRADESVRDTVEGGRVKTAGIFAGEMPQTVITQVYNYRLDYIELAGDESRVYVDNLLSTLVPDIVEKIGVIKTLEINDIRDLDRCLEFEGGVDMFVFKTKEGGPLWRQTAGAYAGGTPFLLGGNAYEGAAEIAFIDNPLFSGIDISGEEFESSPGIKDAESLGTFAAMVRYAAKREPGRKTPTSNRTRI